MANYPVEHTPVYKGKNYDGNGKLSEAEKVSGLTILGRHQDGKGWVIGKTGSKPVTIQDASPTKQNARMDDISKRVDGLESGMVEMKKGQTEMKKGQADMMAILKELLNRDKGAK